MVSVFLHVVCLCCLVPLFIVGSISTVGYFERLVSERWLVGRKTLICWEGCEQISCYWCFFAA